MGGARHRLGVAENDTHTGSTPPFSGWSVFAGYSAIVIVKPEPGMIPAVSFQRCAAGSCPPAPSAAYLASWMIRIDGLAVTYRGDS